LSHILEAPAVYSRQERGRWVARFAWAASRMSPLLAAAAAAGTIVLYLINWPADSRGLQLLLAFGIGAVVWAVWSAAVTDGLTSVDGAGCADTCEELRARVIAAEARLEELHDADGAKRSPMGEQALKQAGRLMEALTDELRLGGIGGTCEELRSRVIAAVARLEELLDADGAKRSPMGEQALKQAGRLMEALTDELRLGGVDGNHGSPYRWALGHGYVNAWRKAHEVEDLLVAVLPAEEVYAAALTSLDRAAGSDPKAQVTWVTQQLATLVAGGGRSGQIDIPADSEGVDAAVKRFDQDLARAVVRESLVRVHKTQNEAWDKIVNVRNGLYVALELAVWLGYATLALTVLQPFDMTTQLTAATAFFLVGAVVGVFNELWARSRVTHGTVFDYGLGQLRLIATPVLSGLAALGGILATNVLGGYLVGSETPDLASLRAIFDLSEYPMGLLVAAIFGLTPGLLLERLNAKKGDYEKMISELSPRAGGGGLPSDANPL
jgi:hypothetical protein